MTTLKTLESKQLSTTISRFIANLIDAFLITIIDCVLMYAFWIIGMALGLLSANADHWYQILSSAPLFAIDGLSVIATPLLVVYLNVAEALHDETAILANLFFATVAVANWLYHAAFESSTARGTPGKVFMDLAVVLERGGKLDFSAASARHFAKMLSALLLGIGFLPIFGKRRNRSLHDLISGCIVARDL